MSFRTAALILFLLPSAASAAPRNLLSGPYSPEILSRVLIPLDQWHPYPTIADRAPWENLPDSLRARYIERGEQALKFEWPNLPATVFLEYARIGNRSNYEDIRNARRGALGSLVMAECVEGKGRFLDAITNGIWATGEETYWGVSAHMGLQKAGSGLPDVLEPTVDLFAAETGALLAWTHYLLGDRLDQISPLIRPRIRYEIDRRILTPNLERDDFWWMGWSSRNVNNWNPWIVSNWLTCTLLVETDSARRIEGVYKTMRSLDNFLNQYPEDGGCDEGPGYWNAAGGRMYDCLELYALATGGKVDIFSHPLVAEIGRYIMKVHIAGRYAVNFADASALSVPSGDLVYRYGKRIGDPRMMGFGSWAESQRSGRRGRGTNFLRTLPDLFGGDEASSVAPAEPFVRDAWLPETQIVVARSKEGSAEGFFVGAKGGHNAESHNHNDVGNFVVYLDGLPVLIDLGVETYTRKTFSDQRYTIWTMRSDYHNLPTVNGVVQMNGRECAAKDLSYSADDNAATFALDLAGAYPKEAGIASWRREIRLDRALGVTVSENYSLSRADSLALTLMTPYEVTVASPGELLARGTPEGSDRSVACRIRFDASKLEPVIERLPVEDERLQGPWGSAVTRILLKASKPKKNDRLEVVVTRG